MNTLALQSLRSDLACPSQVPKKLVPARGFEPRTLGLKVVLRDVRGAPCMLAEGRFEFNSSSLSSTEIRRVSRTSGAVAVLKAALGFSGDESA